MTPARRAACQVTEEVRALPYQWPGPPGAGSVRSAGWGTCASKHALLAEELAALGISSLPLLLVGPLIPEALAHEPEFAGAHHLVEVHECLTVLTPWAGPLLVDVTWDPVLTEHGLPGAPWDGGHDTPPAVRALGRGFAVPRDDLRAHKERLRGRLYGAGEREQRDQLLAAFSQRLALWRD